MDHRHIYHRLAHPRVSLVVLAQTPVQHKPAERPLHHPASRQHHEAHCPLQPTHYLQHPAVDDPHTRRRPLAGITAVCPNLLQPREALPCPVQHCFAAVLVLDVGRMHHAGDQQSQDIHEQVSLAAVDVLAGIVAAFGSTLGGLDRLAVEDAGRRRGLLAGLAASGGVQGMMDAQPQTAGAPAMEVGGDGAPGWEVVGQLPPLAAGAFQVENGVGRVCGVWVAGVGSRPTVHP